MRKPRKLISIPVMGVGLLALAALLVFVPGGLRDRGPWANAAAHSSDLAFALRPGPKSGTDPAIAALQDKLKKDPTDFASYLNLSSAYMQKVRETADPTYYPKVDALLKKAGELDPGNGDLLAMDGVLALSRHDFAAALVFGKQALATNPDQARYYGVVADAQIELGQYAEAVNSLQEMVNRRPDFASFSRIAQARELYGDPEGAEQSLQDALAAGADTPENVAWVYVQIGNLEFNMGHMDEAAKQYEAALHTFPNYQLALAGSGQVAVAQGDLDKAVNLYQDAFKAAPLPAYAIALGDIYTKQGDAVKAKQQFDLVLAIDKLYTANGSITDMEIALFEADHGIDMPDTLKRAKAAYAVRPSIHAADVLAWALYKNGQMTDAEKYSTESLKLGTRDSLKLYHNAVIEQAAGNLPQARADLEQVATLNPAFSLLYEANAAKALTDLRANPAAALAAQKY